MSSNSEPDYTMTLQDWIHFQLPPTELILNANAVDGSSFPQAHPIGFHGVIVKALPEDPAKCVFKATNTNFCSAMFLPQGRKGHRRKLAAHVLKLGWVAPRHCRVNQKRIPAEAYLEQLLRDQLTWSPRGSGADSHRTYEALICKCVPIIVAPDEHMRWKYDGLPVILVEDYRVLSQSELKGRYTTMLSTKYDFSRITRSYWKARRPDVDLDGQSRFWLQKYGLLEKYAGYLL